MSESIKQKQVAGQIELVMDNTFRNLGLYSITPGLVSIREVKVSPDLLEARVYISLFQVPDPVGYMKRIEAKTGEIRKEAGNQLRNKLRKIPVFSYYIDETLDKVFKIEGILKEIDIPEENLNDDQKP